MHGSEITRSIRSINNSQTITVNRHSTGHLRFVRSEGRNIFLSTVPGTEYIPGGTLETSCRRTAEPNNLYVRYMSYVQPITKQSTSAVTIHRSYIRHLSGICVPGIVHRATRASHRQLENRLTHMTRAHIACSRVIHGTGHSKTRFPFVTGLSSTPSMTYYITT